MKGPDEYTQAVMRLASVEQPSEVEVVGRRWTLLPDVFNPGFFVSTAIFDALLEYPVGGAFLEVGCGAGVIAVQAALAGCADVWATDINPMAVENACRNADRHGVRTKMTTRQSNLFDAIPASHNFDTIFWNSNFVFRSTTADPLSYYEQAFFDPGYEHHRRFMQEGPARLRRDGCLLMGFSDLGDAGQLRECLRTAGLRVKTVGMKRAEDGHSYSLELLYRSN